MLVSSVGQTLPHISLKEFVKNGRPESGSFFAVAENCGQNVKSKCRWNLLKPSRALHSFSEIRKKLAEHSSKIGPHFNRTKEERGY
jgi:hypothetical protein